MKSIFQDMKNNRVDKSTPVYSSSSSAECRFSVEVQM
jgi:hypothetical protein